MHRIVSAMLFEDVAREQDRPAVHHVVIAVPSEHVVFYSMGIEVRHAWGMTETSPIATAGTLKVNCFRHAANQTKLSHGKHGLQLD